MNTLTALIAVYALVAPAQRPIEFSNWRFQVSPFWVQSMSGANLILSPYDNAVARNSRIEVRPGVASSQPLDAWFASEWTRILAGRAISRDWGRKKTTYHGIPGMEETAEIQESSGTPSYAMLIALNPSGSINSMLYTADDRESMETSNQGVYAILRTVNIDGAPTGAVGAPPVDPRNPDNPGTGDKPPVKSPPPDTKPPTPSDTPPASDPNAPTKDPNAPVPGNDKTPPTDPNKPGDNSGTPATTAKMTTFDPKTNGFHFVNDFENSVFGPPISLTSAGLCGGMSYAALDYFLAGKPIPKQNWRPAHSTPLQAYFYAREQTSLLENLDKWATYDLNPFGSRNVEIFNWGLRERLFELKKIIDQGRPAQLGLKGTSGGYGHDHQVLAVGYDMGKFNPDTLANVGDLKIFLCEPNFPNELVTMVADPSKAEFYYLEHTDKRWRSYFVDGKYQPMTPPSVADPVDPNTNQDGLVHAMQLSFDTGNEELKGGYLHVNFNIVFHDGTRQEYINISQGGRWLPHYIETVEVVLTTPRRLEDIKFLEVNTNNTVGPSGDRWDLEHVWVRVIGGGYVNDVAFKVPPPFKIVGLPLQIVPQ